MTVPTTTRTVVQDIPAIEVIERLIHLMSTVGHPVAEARRIVVNEVAEHLIYDGVPEAKAAVLAGQTVDRIAPWAVAQPA